MTTNKFMEFLKKNIIQIFRLSLTVVLLLLFSRHFFDIDEKTLDILWTILMFMVGFFYLVLAWAVDKTMLKLTFLACGIFIFAMKFFPDSGLKSIIGIICFIAPFIMARFFPIEEDEESPTT